MDEHSIFNSILSDRGLMATTGLALSLIVIAILHLHRAGWYHELRWSSRGVLHVAALACGLGGLLIVRVLAARGH